jgi:outer membrane immunogenic protein
MKKQFERLRPSPRTAIGLLAILALFIAATMSPVSALAADLAPAPAPVYTKAPPLPVVYDWTGVYVGANVGYSWGQWNASSNQGIFNFESNYANPRLNGWLGGVQAGYNRQFSNPWVLGIEADIQGTGEKASQYWVDPGVPAATCPQGFTGTPPNCVPVFQSFVPQRPGAGPAALNSNWNFPWFGTLRGRAGVTPDAERKWLFYVTGGLAVGESDYSFSWSNPGGAPGRQAYALSSNQTLWGYTVGAGVEAAISGRWTAKLEYLYVDLGTQSINTTDVDGAPFSVSNRVRDQIVRVGLNYRFEGPVVARY